MTPKKVPTPQTESDKTIDETPAEENATQKINSSLGMHPENDDEASGESLIETYHGYWGQTQTQSLHYTCDSCATTFGSRVYRSINILTHPDLYQRFSKRTLNGLACPCCDTINTPEVSILFHHPYRKLFWVYLPEYMRHAELTERIWVLQELTKDPAHIPEYVKGVPVLFGREVVIDFVSSGKSDLDGRSAVPHMDPPHTDQVVNEWNNKNSALDTREDELVIREKGINTKQRELLQWEHRLAEEEELLATQWKELGHERSIVQALEDETTKTIRTNLLDETQNTIPKFVIPVESRSANIPLELEPEILKWKKNGEPIGLLCSHGNCIFLAKLNETQQQYYAKETPELLIQYVAFPSFPLVVLLILPHSVQPLIEKHDLEPDGANEHKLENQEAESGHVKTINPSDILYWTLDITHPPHQEILDLLTQDFSAVMDCYVENKETPAITWKLTNDLSVNVELIKKEAESHLKSIEESLRDISVPQKIYRGWDEDRLGKKKHFFSSRSFVEITTPAEARMALSIVGYWSELENQDYLLFKKSFPIHHWQQIQMRVIRAALGFGLFLNPRMTEIGVDLECLPMNHETCFEQLVSNFAEVNLRMKANDLDPHQEWDNWRLLLEYGVNSGFHIEREFQNLAYAAARRAGIGLEGPVSAKHLSEFQESGLFALFSDDPKEPDTSEDSALLNGEGHSPPLKDNQSQENKPLGRKEEELDDTDILEETIEVEEEDILHEPSEA